MDKKEENASGQKEEKTGSNINRRNFVKSLGATGAVGVFGISGVHAQGKNGEEIVTKLDGDEAQGVLEDLSTEPKYDQLKDEVLRRGEALRPENVTVIRVNGEQHGVIADVPITNTRADEGHLAIGRNVETGKIMLAALHYEDKYGEKIKQTTLDATSGPSFKKTTNRISLEPGYNVEESDNAHTQGRFTCGACKTAVRVIVRVGCDAATPAICTALSMAGVDFMGQSCSEFVGAACNVIEGQGEVATPQLICAAPGLGFCSPPDL